jgi:hypothetical protein
MKKFAVLLISAALAVSSMLPVHAADIKALKGTPTIDGKLDDIYTQSGSLKVDNTMSIWSAGTGKTASDASSVSYFLYDDKNLYIATTVKDSTIVDTGIKSDWMANSVETWIKFSDTAAKNAKIAVDAFNTKIYGSDYTTFDKCKSATTRDKASYIVEVAIPLDTFKTGSVVPISIQINDFLEKEATNGAAWGSQKADNKLTLSDQAVVVKAAETTKPATTTTTTTTSAKTADMSVVASVLALATSALVIFKKKH